MSEIPQGKLQAPKSAEIKRQKHRQKPKAPKDHTGNPWNQNKRKLLYAHKKLIKSHIKEGKGKGNKKGKEKGKSPKHTQSAANEKERNKMGEHRKIESTKNSVTGKEGRRGKYPPIR